MGNSDQEIRLLIKTAYDGTGSKEAIAAQERLKELAKENNALAKAMSGERQVDPIYDSSKNAALMAESEALEKAPEIEAKREQLRRAANRKLAEREIAQEKAQAEKAALDADTRRKINNRPGAADQIDESEGTLPMGGISRVTGLLRNFGPIALAVRAITAAYVDAKRALDEWLASIGRMEKAQQAHEELGTAIDSVSRTTRSLNRDNQDFALQLAQVERQVKTTALEIAHLTEVQQTNLSYQRQLANAQMEAALAKNALDNRFSPMAQIEGEMKIRQEAFDRQMNQDRALEQIHLRSLQAEAEAAEARRQHFAEDQANRQESLISLKQKAEADRLDTDITLAQNKEKRDSALAELLLTERMASGKGTAADKLRYEWFRDTVNAGINPATTESDALNKASPWGTQGPAEVRSKQLREILKDLQTESSSAQDVRDESAFRLNQEQKKVQFDKDEQQNSATEKLKAEEAAKQLQRVIDTEEQYRPDIQQNTIQGMRDKSTLQMLQSLPTPAGGNETTMIETLQQIEGHLADIKSQWS